MLQQLSQFKKKNVKYKLNYNQNNIMYNSIFMFTIFKQPFKI